MTGEQLYILYEEANIEVANCEVEEWGEVREQDKAIWNSIADKVSKGDLP